MDEKTSAIQLRACSTCKFSTVQRAPPPEIFTARVCKRFPPQILAMTQGGQMGITAAFPIVPDDLWCYEYAPDGVANS